MDGDITPQMYDYWGGKAKVRTLDVDEHLGDR